MAGQGISSGRVHARAAVRAAARGRLGLGGVVDEQSVKKPTGAVGSSLWWFSALVPGEQKTSAGATGFGSAKNQS